MHKQPEITAQTKKKMIDVFCELYRHKPIEKITVREITQISKYNRSTFYQHFNDIYDLLDYLETDVLSYLKETAELNFKDIGDVATSAHRVAKLYDEKSDYLSALLGDYGSIRFIDKIKSEMATEVKNSNFSHLSEETLQYVQEFGLSTMISMFRLWHKNNKNISAEEFVTLTYDLIFRGIGNQIQDFNLE